MAVNSASRGFATSIQPASRDLAPIEKDGWEERPAHVPAVQQQKQVQVTGVAESSCRADRATVRISLGSSKESVNDVTNSVSRRLDYIVQTLRQHGVKDEETSVNRYLRREDGLYHMDAEAAVDFSDSERMEEVTRVLLEKLDRSVCVGTPQFYHSQRCLSQLRQRACVSAVDNARQKASEVSLLLGQCLGPPVLVREEETREWRNEEELGEEEEEEEGGEGDGEKKRRGATRSLLPHRPTATASVRVSVSFSLKDRTKKKL